MGNPPIPDILSTWDITAEELSEIVSENPSMRGLMFGFVAEYKLRKEWLLRPEIANLARPRSHDRKAKCDFRFDYRGQDVRLEMKCLDTPKVRQTETGYKGNVSVQRERHDRGSSIERRAGRNQLLSRRRI